MIKKGLKRERNKRKGLNTTQKKPKPENEMSKNARPDVYTIRKRFTSEEKEKYQPGTLFS
jgi:hypothetical protein